MDPSDPRSRKTRRQKKPKPRSPLRPRLVPRDSEVHPTLSRPYQLLDELTRLERDHFPNAASVTLRVFLEMSTFIYLKQTNHKQSGGLQDWLRLAAEDLGRKSRLESKNRKAVVALSGKVPTLHQFVPNEDYHPEKRELTSWWDSLEAFLTALWDEVGDQECPTTPLFGIQAESGRSATS